MNDPMEVLRLPVVPIAPRPAFAGELRARVAAWLGGDDDPEAATAATAATAADVAATVTPYLSVRGAAEAIPWYVEVLGAVPMGDPIMDADGRVGHMELRFGNVTVSVADEYPELDILSPASRGGTTVTLQLVVADCDDVFARAVAAGAEVRRTPEDQFYGARVAEVTDRWGHRWHLHQPTEEVSQGQMAERLAGTEYEFRALDEVQVPEIDLGSRARQPAHDQGRVADQIGDLGYFTIDAPDPDAAAEFFGALFGWRVEQGNLAEGRHIATIAPPGGIHGGRPPGYTIYFRVDDLHAAAARVRALGGEVLDLTEYPSGGNATCRDPQGVPFELWKPAPGY